MPSDKCYRQCARRHFIFAPQQSYTTLIFYSYSPHKHYISCSKFQKVRLYMLNITTIAVLDVISRHYQLRLIAFSADALMMIGC